MNFWELLTKFKSKEIETSPYLYHYTSLDTFCAMTNDKGDFYCTHFNALNDDAEVLVGESLVEEYLKKKYAWTDNKCRWFQVNFRTIVKSETCVIPWIMSFSRDRDSLNQWVSYTDKMKGGVAIGFSRNSIVDAIDRMPGCYQKDEGGKYVKQDSSSFVLRLLPCLYKERDAELIVRLFDELLPPHKDALERLGTAKTSEEMLEQDFIEAINTILEISTVIKHNSFENEQEERLVLMPMTRTCSDCEIIGGKPRWKTHVSDTTFEGIGNPKYRGIRGMMREVVISPHGDRGILLTSVKVLCNKYNMNFCKISESQSPYNGR